MAKSLRSMALWAWSSSVLLLGLGLVGMLTPLQVEAGDPHVINLHPEGPHPEGLTIRVGTAVVWVSHLATTKLVVTTVAFLEGQGAAQATSAVGGYNGFVLEGEHFVGRMDI